MPLIWRYLMRVYFKATSLTLLAFVVLLLLLRIEEIAHFAAMGSSFKQTFYFAALLVPYILPMALPLSCLIASAWTFSKLCNSGEWTALYSSGFSPFRIFSPIIFLWLFLGISNTIIASEISTRTHLAAKNLRYSWSSFHPLYLLKQKQLLKLPKTVMISDELENDVLHNIAIATLPPHKDRIQLTHIRALSLDEDSLIAHGFSQSLLLDKHIDQGEVKQPLYIENIAKMHLLKDDFALIASTEPIRISPDHLHFGLLVGKLIDEQMQGNSLATSSLLTEFARRLFTGWSCVSMGLLGLVTGFGPSRSRKSTTLATTCLTLMTLSSFFAAGANAAEPMLAITILSAPHLLIAGWASFRLNQTLGV